MARSRKPLALAKLDGSAAKNAGRFKGRNEPTGTESVGDPPLYLQDTDACKARSAWFACALEIPWLNSSHRMLLETVSLIRGEIMAGNTPGIQKLTLLRQCMISMGATPADASKVGRGGEEKEDEEESFFNGG